MKLKVFLIIVFGYILAVTVVSIGNVVGERYKHHITKEIISPIVSATDMANMDRNEIFKLMSQPEFKNKYKENMASYEKKMSFFTISSLSLQFLLLLALGWVSTVLINRIYVAKA